MSKDSGLPIVLLDDAIWTRSISIETYRFQPDSV